MKVKGEVIRTAFSSIKIETEVPDNATDEDITNKLVEEASDICFPNEYASEYDIEGFEKINS